MNSIAKPTLIAFVSCLLACALAACGSANASSASESQEPEAAEEQTISREEVEAVLNAAAEKTFSSVEFTTKTETTATGGTANGTAQTQTIQTTTKGELDKSGEKPQMHMAYSAISTMELGKTTYDMYLNSDNLIVKQNEQLYVDAMTEETLNSYADSVTSVISADEINNMLDMASSYKLTEDGSEKTVSVTIDKDKLLEASVADESSLPENNSIATMVMSYTVGDDGRFKTVRIMSSTSGTPTYRVNQSYQFANYDNVTLPEWPDLKAYVAQQSGIMTDENGRMYIIGDDGQAYYVTEIGDDGMIYYENPTANTTDDSTTTYVPTQEVNADTSTSNANGSTSSGNNSEEQGRAYITADDGTIHFLDEEGSRLIENEDGTRYFIDADGNFYFLAD